MFKKGTCHVKDSYEVVFIYRKPMTPKKCMFIAKSLTDPLHVELEPLCTCHCDQPKNIFKVNFSLYLPAMAYARMLKNHKPFMNDIF